MSGGIWLEMVLTTPHITPRWLGIAEASLYSGLGQRVIQTYIKNGFIRSSNCVAPGSTRGRRLIDRESLDAFIEAGVGGKTLLKMNEQTEAAAGRAK